MPTRVARASCVRFSPSHLSRHFLATFIAHECCVSGLIFRLNLTFAAADALAVARFLKNTDESAYHYLTRVPIVFHRKQKEFESIQKQPIIRVDENDVRILLLIFRRGDDL